MSALVQGFKRKIKFRGGIEGEWGTSASGGTWTRVGSLPRHSLCSRGIVMKEDIQDGF